MHDEKITTEQKLKGEKSTVAKNIGTQDVNLRNFIG